MKLFTREKMAVARGRDAGLLSLAKGVLIGGAVLATSVGFDGAAFVRTFAWFALPSGVFTVCLGVAFMLGYGRRLPPLPGTAEIISIRRLFLASIPGDLMVIGGLAAVYFLLGEGAFAAFGGLFFGFAWGNSVSIVGEPLRRQRRGDLFLEVRPWRIGWKGYERVGRSTA